MDVLADHLYFALRLVPNFVAKLCGIRRAAFASSYARASSRSLRTRSRGRETWLLPYGSQPPTRGGYGVLLNAQLIHRVFTQCLARTLPGVSVRCLPRSAYCLRDTTSILFGRL